MIEREKSNEKEGRYPVLFDFSLCSCTLFSRLTFTDFGPYKFRLSHWFVSEVLPLFNYVFWT